MNLLIESKNRDIEYLQKVERDLLDRIERQERRIEEQSKRTREAVRLLRFATVMGHGIDHQTARRVLLLLEPERPE